MQINVSVDFVVSSVSSPMPKFFSKTDNTEPVGCLFNTASMYETGCGRHAAAILCQLLHFGHFRGPKSVVPVDDLTSSSSLKRPATTMSLYTGACEHNSSDKKCY